MVSAYAAFGLAASALGRVLALSREIYGVLALALFAAGVAGLLGARPYHCAAEPRPARPVSLGAAYMLGGSFALVVSPCCTPVVAAIVAYASAGGDTLCVVGLLAFFAAGHAVPLLGLGFGGSAVRRMLERGPLHQASSIVSASLMLALALYYAVLA